ncbi:MAG: riboflavin synthase [Woeseiaceae bacterium]|nr:riboflavin synthase [Woeseiaceae bacterium]
MFTGIIQAKGSIAALERHGGDVRLSVQSDSLPFASYEVGESIAVNGVCLTAVALRADGFDTDVSVETLDVTSLGGLGVGDNVNLEPSLSLGDRLGGHLVSGHVDCLGTVTGRKADARSIRITVEIPEEFARYVARKGSVTVDGVSLTVNDVSATSFEVNIIPHTADVTIIGDYAVGTNVNVEVDLLARYIERLLAKDGEGLSMEFLKEHGYG